MTTPNEERIVRYTLQLGIDPLEEAEQSIGDAIAQRQRDATEVTRLEAARRQRIESDSIREIAKLQAETLAERQRLERESLSGVVGNRVERPEKRINRDVRSAPPPENVAKQDYAALADASKNADAPDQSRSHDLAAANRSPVAATPSPLQVEVKAKREYVVKVEENIDQLVTQVAEQIEMQLEEREQLILEQVKRRFVEKAIGRNNSIAYMGTS